MWKLFVDVFNKLPFVAIVDSKTFARWGWTRGGNFVPSLRCRSKERCSMLCPCIGYCRACRDQGDNQFLVMRMRCLSFTSFVMLSASPPCANWWT